MVLLLLYATAFTPCIYLSSLNSLCINWHTNSSRLQLTNLHQICLNDVPTFNFLASTHWSIPSSIHPSLHLSPIPVCIIHSPPPGPGDPSWSSCGPPAGWRWAPAARTAGGPSHRWWVWGSGSRSTRCGGQTEDRGGRGRAVEGQGRVSERREWRC